MLKQDTLTFLVITKLYFLKRRVESKIELCKTTFSVFFNMLI